MTGRALSILLAVLAFAGAAAFAVVTYVRGRTPAPATPATGAVAANGQPIVLPPGASQTAQDVAAIGAVMPGVLDALGNLLSGRGGED